MSPNDSTLWYFSAGFILVMSLVLVVPILRRKTDVFTTWNMFLLGAIIFNGFSGFNASAPGHYLPTYTTKDYNMYYLGVLIYYPVAIFTYYYWKYPRRLAGRRLLKWPKLSGWSLVILTLILMTIGLFSRFHLPIPVLGQLLFQFGVVTPILALSCAFIAWYRSPSNIMLMILLVALGASTFVIVLGLGGTRRYLMSTLAVAPFALYWVWLRYKSTQQIIIWIVAALFIGVPVLKAFGSIRHTITGAGGLERSMQVIARLPTEIARGGSMEGFMGQDSVECALLTIHMLNDKSDRLAVSPFHATVFVITNPVPRALWPEKPISLGLILPDVARLAKKGINANLGVNVAAQCYYDGGYFIHVLYGILTAAFFRFYDELLIRQPGNPLLVGGLVFMAPQIMGFSRGAIDTMGLQIVLGFVTVVLCAYLPRIFLGTGLVYPRTDQLVEYPVLRSQKDWADWMQSFTAAPDQARSIAARDDDEEEDLLR